MTENSGVGDNATVFRSAYRKSKEYIDVPIFLDKKTNYIDIAIILCENPRKRLQEIKILAEGKCDEMTRTVIVLFVCMLVPFCMGNKNLNAERPEVASIQLNTSRFTPEQFGEKKLESLLAQLYDPDRTTSDIAVDESDVNHDVITLFYGSGEKESFCFHNVEDIWYMRTENGAVFQDVAFVSDYIEHVENSQSSVAITLSFPEEELLTLLLQDGKLDERYLFTVGMKTCMEYGLSREEAEESVRENMLKRYLLYQYAIRNGYQPEEEILKNQIKDFYEKAENGLEIKALLERAGISQEEYLEVLKLGYQMDAAEEYLYSVRYNVYKHGNGTIGEHVCSDFREYWNLSMSEILETEGKKTDCSEYKKILDDAAEFAMGYIE